MPKKNYQLYDIINEGDDIYIYEKNNLRYWKLV